MAWDRIVAWLRTNAPVTADHLGPPATADDVMIVESLLDQPLPADLLAWWRHSCGVTGYVEGRVVPPRFAPYTIDESVDCRETMLETASPDWSPRWLPLAHDGGGNYLFVDPRTGCVTEWDEYEAAGREPRWPSVAAMLAEIADALEHGTDIDGYQAEARDDGILDWV